MSLEKSIAQLKSRSPKLLIHSLSLISSKFTNKEIDDEYIESILSNIIPLLTSSHIQIRIHAFTILEAILENHLKNVPMDLYFSQLIEPISLTLNHIDDNINQKSVHCLNLLLAPPSDIEFDVYSDLFSFFVSCRSLEIRILILRNLQISNRQIPLNYIIPLVDDPNSIIQNIALKILSISDKQILSEKLSKFKLSPRSKSLIQTKCKITYNVNKDNNNSYQSQNAQTLNNSSLNVKNGKKSKTLSKTLPKEKMNLTAPSNKRLNQKQKTNYLELTPNNNTKNSQTKHYQLDSIDQNEEEMINLKPNLDQNLNPKENEENSKNDSLNSDNDDIKKKNDLINSPIGKIKETYHIFLPYRKEDVIKMTWPQKFAFIKDVKKSLNSKGKLMNSPKSIFDCIILTTDPIHEKVKFMLPQIFKTIILLCPEILIDIPRCEKLIFYTLYTMNGEEWKENIEFNDFLHTLFVEGNPFSLIDMALNINYKSNLKLPCEYFILNIYVEYPDLILSLGSLSHLLCYLLHSFPLDLAQQELVNYVCQKQPQQVAKYWCGLPLEEKDKIEKFLDVKNVLKNKRKTNRNKKNGGNHLEKNILTQIFEIFDKGDASDLNECLTLIDNYSDQLSDCIMKFNDIFDYSFYLKFVRFISKCKNNDIDNNSNLVENICAKYFGDSQLLIFLGNDWISHDLINGTAKIIWSSPSSLLQGSDKYLLNLYQVFKGSKGSTRYDIVKIFIAIEYVTNVSIFNFPDVIEPYRGLIESMIDQFQVDS